MKSLFQNLISISLGLASAQTSSGAQTGAAAACEDLETLAPTKLVIPGELQYNTTNANYFDTRSIKKPACIFLPETAQDVSAAIKIITRRVARFAVKSGGHMPGEFTNIDNGVLIATERLNKLEWEGDSILRVGPGLRWGEVYHKAAEKGRVVIGGRLKQVGVAGLVLGGGISFLGGEYGFSCDNVKGFEVVLANGSIKYASQDQNSDLYRALRGGSSNFGIVTRFDMDAYSVPLGWASIGYSDLNAAPQFLSQFLNAISNYALTGAVSDKKTGIIAVITRAPSAGVNVGTTNLWRSEPSETPPAVFNEFLAVPGQHTNQNMPLYALADAFGDREQPKMQNAFRTGSFIANKELIFEIEKIHTEEFTKVADVLGLSYALTFQPITQNMILAGNGKRGGNVFGLETRANKGPFIWTEQFASWALPSDTERVQAAQRAIAKRAADYAKSKGLWDQFVYLNDADTDQKADVFPAYGRANQQFLARVKAKYDFLGVFTNLMPGGFKL